MIKCFYYIGSTAILKSFEIQYQSVVLAQLKVFFIKAVCSCSQFVKQKNPGENVLGLHHLH